MKTDTEKRWAITRKLSWNDVRTIAVYTLAYTKSDAITLALKEYATKVEHCHSRTAKWRHLKGLKDFEFRAEEVIIHTKEDFLAIPKKKRCCPNCIDFATNTKGGLTYLNCRQGNLHKTDGSMNESKIICDKHRFYEEVFPQG